MNRLLIILSLILTDIQFEDVFDTRNSELEAIKTETKLILSCKRCVLDSTLILTEKWKRSTYSEISSFLCAWGENCDWPESYIEFVDGQYLGPAWDMLFILFYAHFEEYNEILNKNESLNLDYLLKLYSTPEFYDLPHDSILKKLRSKTNKTSIDFRLIEAFEDSLTK